MNKCYTHFFVSAGLNMLRVMSVGGKEDRMAEMCKSELDYTV
jgi:hypothetical protein